MSLAEGARGTSVPTLASSLRAMGLSAALAAAGTLLAAVLLAVSILHWGGAYPHVGAWLQLGGAALWAVLAAGAFLHARARRAGPDGIDLAVGLFLAYAAWTFTRSPVEYSARLEWCWILTYAALFGFVRHGLPSRRWAMALLGILVLAATASCIFAFIQRGNPVHEIWGMPRPNYGQRISGTFGCPNHFANLMVMATLACLFLGSYSRLAWPLRILLFYLATVLTAGLFFSVSRGGYVAWLAGIAVVAVFLFRSGTLRWWWKAAGLAAVAGGVVTVVTHNPFVMDRLDRMMAGDVRLQLARISADLWQRAPLWGHGIGSYDYIYLRHHGPELQSRALYAHCDYLNTLVDYGTVGLALILAFTAVLAWNLRCRGRSEPHEREQLLVRLGWAALAAMMAHSVFDFSLHIPACALAFFTILGAACMRTPREERPRSGGGTGRAAWAAYALLALAASAALALPAWRTLSGQRAAASREDVFRGMTIEAIDRQGESLYAKDPAAYPLLRRYGDALRVKTAELDTELEQAPLERRGELLRRREEAGRLALKYYQRAHRSASWEDTLLVRQGMVLDVLDRHAEAYLAYAQAVQLQPDNRYFRFTFALHLIETGQRAEAMEQLRRAASMPLDAREDPTLRESARAVFELIRRR